MADIGPDKYAILAQIMRWAERLDMEAEYSGAHELVVAKEMRTFVAAIVIAESETENG